jgi:GDP-L-fucose synthase
LKNFYKNKNILVTGASGFIGTNLIKRLLSLQANVTGVLHKQKPQLRFDKVKYLKKDLTIKKNCLVVCKNIDYVFMCAANSSGAATIQNAPLNHLTPNIVMNAYMLNAAYEKNVKKFAFISSNTVYPVSNNPMKENDSCYKFFEKYHIVGWMKSFSEEMCKMYSQHVNPKMKTLIVRPANLYGPYDKFNPTQSKVIASIIRKFFIEQNPIEVWGDGNDIKDFLYIDDFINGLIKAFVQNKITGPINLASSTSVTIKDIIKNLKIITKRKKISINYNASKPTMIPVRLISNAYAKKVINFKVKNNLYKGLKKTYEWFALNHKKINDYI